MKIISLKELTLPEEIASYICSKLKENAIDVVLTGGSCMEIYTNSNYSSYDLDFIANPSHKEGEVSEVMLSLGFKNEGRYFKHKDNDYYVEFPTGPLNVGNEFPSKLNELKTYVGKLTLLTATDCVKDRLCAFVYHNGEECYSQATAVAHLNEINKDDLSNWAKKESEKMEAIVTSLWKDISFLNQITTDNLIIEYLKTKEISNKVNIEIESEFEELSDDLLEDYIIHKLIDVEMDDDENYYLKMKSIYTELIIS